MLMLSEYIWLHVTETVEKKTVDKGDDCMSGRYLSILALIPAPYACSWQALGEHLVNKSDVWDCG